ncbi:hypothetical protein [Phycicoccus sp.]|uniref:hypothetical protein n=1 Tax=Phycicoccus sp. TaxID=1902410 RepID=UPI002C133314|nr:hypothetical protein [Phycicoccus sp.]HMM95776.1 hypothetical protein [Phycicoccus sp.]
MRVTGRLTSLVTDAFRSGRSTTTVGVVPDGQPAGFVRVEGLPGAAEHPLLGARVTATGRRTVTGGIRVAASGIARASGTGSTPSLAPVTAAATTGPRTYRILAVSVRFADDPTNAPAAPSTVAAGLFSGPTSVRAYYQDVSDGLWTLTGRAVGPYTVSRSNPSACDFQQWANSARTAARAAGIDLSAYTNVMVVLPRQTSCGWDGLAEVPGTLSWINERTPSLLVTAHELGHNFGEHHASGYRCTVAGVRVMLSTAANCPDPTGTSLEYADPFSVMGNVAARLHHAEARVHYDLVPPKTVEAGQAETVRLAPADSGSGIRVLRLTRPDGTWLAAEYRRPTGAFDTFAASDPVVNGVTFRIDRGVGLQTWLLDARPSTASFLDAPVLPGGSVTDPLTQARVDVVSVSPTGAILQVSSPTAPTGLAVFASGSTVIAHWGAPTGVSGVVGYDVALDGRTQRTTSPSWSGPAARGWHTLTVRAVDGSGTVYPPATTRVLVTGTR